ncbi:hypothetical protein SBY92_005195 [Candida maltosa Xu316]
MFKIRKLPPLSAIGRSRSVYTPFRSLRIITSPRKPTFTHVSPLTFRRSIGGSSRGRALAANLGGIKFIVQAITGVYCGIIIVCAASFYLLYRDADERQNIPGELSMENIINSVLAINKDDVCEAPRHATKHYRRLLFNLAKEEYPDLKEEELENRYDIPILSTRFLMEHDKSNKFINFYFDMILRYCKCLLSKGEVDISINILSRVINDDFVFYQLGDSEKLSSSCRVLVKITPDYPSKIKLLERSIDMLVENSNKTMRFNDKNSKISDELINCLNDLASTLAKYSQQKDVKINKKDRSKLLNDSLEIYLSELRNLQNIRKSIESKQTNQFNYPLFNVERANLICLINATKAHISEVLWIKGHKTKAIDWAEEILNELYFDRLSDPRVNPILLDVLGNLEVMYADMKKPKEVERVAELKKSVKIYEGHKRFNIPWYERVMKRISNTIYLSSPIGLVQKGVDERFKMKTRVKELYEFEDEDEEYYGNGTSGNWLNRILFSPSTASCSQESRSK